MKKLRTISMWLVFAAALAGAPQVPLVRAAATSSVQEELNSFSQQIADLNQQIAQYQAEINKADTDKTTLQGAINSLNLQQKKVTAQIAATQKQIAATQLQIDQLGAGIESTGQIITSEEAAIAENMRSIAETDNRPLILILFSSGSFSDALDSVETTLKVERAVQDEVSQLQTHKDDLTAKQTASQQKQDTLTAQKRSLASQQAQLAQTKTTKTRLLAETNAQESNYEKLLAQAKAQLASFSTFAQNAGGAGLLVAQTSCDAWGCYYNQRDAAWGNDPLDGTKYLLKSDGCLVTSVAMVMTHYGYRGVTPVTINSDPNNFAAYYPAYLLMTIHVDGLTVTRKTALIDATLSSGNPVIVGVNAYGGTHFVVLVSGSKGHYLMRDPYIANGKDISFTAHYTMNSIFGISKVTIQ